MRSARLLVAAAVGLAGLAVLPASAAAPVTQLVGVTTVVTSHSGSVDVDLDRDAFVRFDKDGTTPDISLTGAGRFVYAALYMKQDSASGDGLGIVRTTNGRTTRTWQSVSGSYYPKGSSCPQDPTAVASVPGVYQPCTPSNPAPRLAVLHQGHYHLRVMTDGSPLTLTITLHGLPGERRVELTRTLRSSVVRMHSIDGTADRTVRAESDAVTARRSWAIVSLDASLAPGAAVTDQTYCTYPAGPVARTDYRDSCPGGDSFGFTGSLILTPFRQTPPLLDLNGDEVAAGSHRIGLSLSDEQGVTFRGGLVALLEAE